MSVYWISVLNFSGLDHNMIDQGTRVLILINSPNSKDDGLLFERDKGELI